VPVLQLDIIDGIYDGNDETIVTSSSIFTLVAYGFAEGNKAVTTSEQHYISISLTPKTGPTVPANIGSFTFAEVLYDMNSPWIFGTPPMDTVYTNADKELGPHDIFETLYLELAFNFSGDGDTRNSVNTQTDFGSDPTDLANAGTALYYQLFSVDVSNLFTDYQLHFDLYNTKVANRNSEDIGPDDFAPFSHDAATIPESTSLALMLLGLFGLGFVRGSRKKY